MRIEQLEYIAAVTQHGSLRRASERLHISQPALSEAVSKLERELGVTLLDRRRSGARISRRGRDLQQYMTDVLEAVDRLRLAAGDLSTRARVVHLGTVSSATSTLLVPAVRALHETHAGATIEMLNLQQAQIYEGLAEGSLDLGLVNLLDGDDLPPSLRSTPLVHGRPVVVLRTDHPLAQRAEITLEELRAQPFVAMRAGYLMHRFAHRVFGASTPPISYTTDGAELGKVMVAERLGLSLLPDFSVIGDPLEQAGVITYRPLAGDGTSVTLVLAQRRDVHAPQPVRDLQEALVETARSYRHLRAAPVTERPA